MKSARPGLARLDQGIATITVAISMVVLIGIAALAIDGSNLYRERSDVQNAADLAAYAAAYDACIGGSDPAAVGMAQAVANGFDNSDPDVSVAVAEESGGWRATITSTVDGYFSNALGASDLDATATALATCTSSETSLPAVFAGGRCSSGHVMDWSGSVNVVGGGLHSNDDIKMGGSDNTVDGTVTYVTGSDISGSGNSFSGGLSSTTWQNWPIELTPSDFLPGGLVETAVGSGNYHFTNGEFDLKSNVADGVYVARQGIKMGDSNFSAKVTLVTLPRNNQEDKGTIEISGSNVDLEPYYQDVLIFSNYFKGGKDYPYSPPPYSDPPECGNPAVKIAGSNNAWEGLIFAPRGMIEISGGNNSTLQGSIFGHNVKFNGSDITITALTSSTGGAPQTVLLK